MNRMRSHRRHFKADGMAKKEYPDQEAALDQARRSNGNGPKRYHAYECDWCGHWHVGMKRGGGLKSGPLPPGKRVRFDHRGDAA